MKICIDGRIRNYIFIFVLGVVIIFLVVVCSVAAEQDKVYRVNYLNYQQAIQLIGQGKYAPAEKILAQLDQESRASYQVLYYQAYCAMNTGDYSSAADYMQKVQEVRPAYLADKTYLQQYGIILFNMGEYQRAKLYLQESMKYKDKSEARKEAVECLTQIEMKEKGGR